MPTLVISGANRGLGLEFVSQYLNAGWDVYAGCRKPEQATELNKLSGQASKGTLYVMPLDVTDAQSRQRFCGAVGNQTVDLLINNAGTYGPKGTPLGDVDEAEWARVFATNTISPLKMTEALLPNLRAATAAKVVNISSKMGSMDDNGSGGLYMYRSSKAALNAVSKSMSIDLRNDGISVANLHPGWVLTDMGGPNALIDAQTSVAGMRQVIDSLTPEQSGQFIAYDGAAIPW